MLSSERDGEVVNAARAISRTLRTAGADWHDLTGLLATPPKTQTRKPRNDGGDWRAMRRHCLEHQNRLSARELEFVTSLDRWRGKLTPKQSDWLQAIYERISA